MCSASHGTSASSARTFRLDATEKDLAALAALITWRTVIRNETLENSSLDDAVGKPWGRECRIFADNFFDVWYLRIEAGERTSLHAHVKKVTHLLCLSGEGVVTSLNGEKRLSAGGLVTVAAGAFHSTSATNGPLTLVEIETPRNKLDLVRLDDAYRRDTTHYEQSVQQTLRSRLRELPQMPGAMIRSDSPDGRFGFSIETGTDVQRGGHDESVLFYVPVGLRVLLMQPGTPLRPVGPESVEVDTRVDYLAIRSRRPGDYEPDEGWGMAATCSSTVTGCPRSSRVPSVPLPR